MQNQNNQKGSVNLILIGIIVVLAIAAAYLLLAQKSAPVAVQPTPVITPRATPKATPMPMPTPTPDANADWKIYKNEKYGFQVTLLDSWKGYSVITEYWHGITLDESSTEYQGPEIKIRNPKWTAAKPWQDIPIMIFTKEEWKLIEANNLNISAAPIGPIRLDENQKYVFALPPRWVGFTDELGQEEAQEISQTLKAIPLSI